MKSRKIIIFPLMTVAIIAFILGTGSTSAQMIPKAGQSHLDDASCETTWDGNSWQSCESAHVLAETAYDATFCLSAPACDYHCIAGDIHYPGSRYATLSASNLAPGQYVTDPECPGGEPCPQCCVTHHWTTISGVTYWVNAYNTTGRLECGPTKARFERGTFNCNYE